MEQPLVENIDYYINERGLFVFTELYHKKRGYCCGNGCLHCPWSKKQDSGPNDDVRPKENR
ncbi:MAG: hypothetical protein EOO04_32360 [Chitinophagaceae bacterium]|nr:MAG: hypothetical protein EOO04_32360 [Chitinophagaceae bacterium]